MHTLKGNLIGQTFVHAKYDDSGERRRSRIRRSKEERKAMVESFIKKHQILNSGSFPSLNLTHKEVGGSFYTVREIIREIIQENKVLGPAKLAQGGENQENILEHYPIGSIAIQPEIDSLSLDAVENELHVKPISSYNLSEGHPFNTNLEFNESELSAYNLSEKHPFNTNLEFNESELSANNLSEEHPFNTSLEFNESELSANNLSEEQHSFNTNLEFNESELSADNLSEEHHFNTNLELNESEQCVFADNETTSAYSLLEKHADEAEANGTLEMEEMLDLSVISDDEANVKEISTTRRILEDSITSEGEATAISTMDTEVGKDLENLGAFAAEVSDKELEVVGGSVASKDGVNILTKEKNIAELVETVPEVREAKTTSIASDFKVETFPVAVSKTIHGSDDITVTLEQEFNEDDEMSFTKSPIPSQEEETHFEDKNRVQESEEAHMGISNGYAARNDHFVDGSSNSESALHVEIKPLLIDTDKLQNSYQKTTHGAEKEHIPTLDRMNLESWKAPAKTSPVQLADAPLAFLNAIISSFIKFWME